MDIVLADERDDISRAESDKFKSIFGEVESLHEFGKSQELDSLSSDLLMLHWMWLN